MIDNSSMIETMNDFGRRKVPFLFIIDFDAVKPVIMPLADARDHDILYNIDGARNYENQSVKINGFTFEKYPMPYSRYKEAFDFVVENQNKGNSYLLNLTFPTRVVTDLSFRKIFYDSTALYKLFFRDEFVVFSPETFVTISDGIISSCPMKGTIDAALPDAEKVILADEKEFAEHVTIVDLIRNDLNIVAKNVRVEKFRYIDRIKTHRKELLQVSSLITGELEKDYHKRLGDIMASMLPAGSVTGAPKKKTVELIKEAEKYDRGYYTGVFGFYDGLILKSAVMIRYLEKLNGAIWYKSGGGITVYSDPVSEYNELVDKVYVPIIGNDKD
ncbi:MAG: aminodeoxychorismate synthase component I [Spirochaetes bacterium RBG_16_49_21]|nr:MAG: aminodeoxychorismate synthase component I [Spirochaetes bacterium RBG_16_49_21]